MEESTVEKSITPAITVHLCRATASHLEDPKVRQEIGLDMDCVQTILKVEEQDLLPKILRTKDGTLLLEITDTLAPLLMSLESTVGALHFYENYSPIFMSCYIDVGDKWRFFGDIVRWSKPGQDVLDSQELSQASQKWTDMKGQIDENAVHPMVDSIHSKRYKLLVHHAADRDESSKPETNDGTSTVPGDLSEPPV